jgi:glycine C-acetyltransferase
MNRLDWIQKELKNLKEAGLFNRIRVLGSPQGAWLEVDGKKALNFCSNNYLGLANHPQLVTAAKAAIDQYGVGPAAVRTIAGTMKIHEELRCSYHLPVRIQRQPGHDPGIGRQGRCYFLRRTEPCQHH